MLPGFRFLFAAVVLSVSILVFGLGAAALLRAAHEEFSSNPSWHAAPETMFAQRGEAARPVLAMLRIEPPPAAQKPDDVPAAAAPAEPTTVAAAPAESERIAALRPEDSSLPGTAKLEIPAAESPAPSEAAPALADAPAPADETKIAATEQAVPLTTEAAPAASEQINASPAPDADAASTKIAALGGASVAIEAPPSAKAASAKPDRSVIKKRLQARRAAQRRRIAARARVAARQAPADPFTQPTIQPATAARSR
jgi:hypothetical protein